MALLHRQAELLASLEPGRHQARVAVIGAVVDVQSLAGQGGHQRLARGLDGTEGHGLQRLVLLRGKHAQLGAFRQETRPGRVGRAGDHAALTVIDIGEAAQEDHAVQRPDLDGEVPDQRAHLLVGRAAAHGGWRSIQAGSWPGWAV